MHETGIYLLTGPIGSGKTSALLEWAGKRKDVHGILTPVMNGQRVFMDIYSGEQFNMEAGEDESLFLQVGRYRFSRNGFDKAEKIIKAAVNEPGWLVIDEIGPLELKGLGFRDMLFELLEERKGSLILVVRENDHMPERVVSYFGLKHVIYTTPAQAASGKL